MAEYMSREDYCEETCGKENRDGYKTCHNCGMLNVPTAEVQTVRHGKWIVDDLIQCSICNITLKGKAFKWIARKYFKYCPNCGARMDGDTE